MKIAILAHLKFPIAEPFAGGLERHTHLLTTRLKARGHAVTLFAADGSDPKLRPIAASRPTGDARDVSDGKRIDRLELATYAAMMEAIAGAGFDVVHNNSLHPLPHRLASSLATPMLTVLHTPPFATLVDGIRAAGSTGIFVAVSRTLAEEWRGIAPSARVVGNGIDLGGFPYRASSDTSPRLIWSGRIVPEKGLHLAIDAARAAALPLSFAGLRSAGTYWQDEIAPRLGEDTTDLGHLGHAELAAHLGRSRVAVVTPRWEEPFGLVAAEALACGTPVAAFARGALPDIIGPECGCLAEPDDVAGLARAIRDAAALDRRICRRRAEDLFDAETMIDAYEGIYRDLVALAPRAAVGAPERCAEGTEA